MYFPYIDIRNPKTKTLRS